MDVLVTTKEHSLFTWLFSENRVMTRQVSRENFGAFTSFGFIKIIILVVVSHKRSKVVYQTQEARTMVFTAAKTVAFFTQDTQMAIPQASINR